MRTNRNINVILGVIVFCLIIFNMYSCDSFVKNEKGDKERVSIINENISIDKHEAQLLVLVSQDNLNVIELCEMLEDEKTSFFVEKVIKEIKEEHIEILEKYNTVASENVISIPAYSNIGQTEKENLEGSKSLVITLKILKSKINNEIALLEKLIDTTDNSDFKELARYANRTLKENLNRTMQTLEILQENS